MDFSRSVRRLKHWGIGWCAVYVLLLPAALAFFLAGFEVAYLDSTPWFSMAIGLIALANILLLVWASSLSMNRISEARAWLTISPVAAAVILLAVFGESAVGSPGTLTRKPWSFVWVTQLLVGSGWLALWLPQDYAEIDEGVHDPALFLRMVHDEYQAFLWPAVAVAVTAFLSGILQVAELAAADKSGNLPAFGLLQAVVIILVGICMSLPVVRILGHVTVTRWKIAAIVPPATPAVSATPSQQVVTMPVSDSSLRAHGIIGQIADIIVIFVGFIRK